MRFPDKLISIFSITLLLMGLAVSCGADEKRSSKPLDIRGGTGMNIAADKTETIVLGGGCFWCMEAVFENIPGVLDVLSGYAGGNVRNPDYKQVSSGTTGHAEVVQILYDPSVISLDDIWDLFWRAHDPTTLNRQGADTGTQYRSIILYQNDEQKKSAQKYLEKEQKSGHWKDPIVTEIVPLEHFYPAEAYHQDYYAKNPTAGYCQVVIRPKLEKLGLNP